jgi:small-conductance mechanosensitive channel
MWVLVNVAFHSVLKPHVSELFDDLPVFEGQIAASLIIERFLSGTMIFYLIVLPKKMMFRIFATRYNKKVFLSRIQGLLNKKLVIDQLTSLALGTRTRMTLGKDEFGKTQKNLATPRPVLKPHKSNIFTVKSLRKANTMSIQSAVSFLKRKTKNVSRDQTTARYTKEKVDKAKEMAKEVFNTLADPGNPSISAEDLVRKGMSEQAAQAAVEIVTSADDDLGISRKDLLRFCGKVTYDTCALSATLRDSSSIVGTMEGLFNIIIYMVMVIVFLMLFKFNVSDFLLGTSTFIVAAAFALGDSAKNAINNIVFIFFIRPYDVGDRIVLDEDWMIVARIHLTHTVFRIWNGKLRTIPNTELLTMRIDNLRRAGNYTHDKVIEIASDTPLHLIEQLVRCIAACIAAKPREFYPKFTFHLEDIKKEKLLFNLWVTQRSSAQDANTEWTNNRTILVHSHAHFAHTSRHITHTSRTHHAHISDTRIHT